MLAVEVVVLMALTQVDQQEQVVEVQEQMAVQQVM